jgi:riboflavin synthase
MHGVPKTESAGFMFTGIVEGTGVIAKIKPTAKAIQMTVQAGKYGQGVKLGDSVAVNGCCLTVVKVAGAGARRTLQFDLLLETWQRTNFAAAETGALVNLERSLAVNSRLGGHFVTGHIDGTGEITRWERAGQDHVIEIAAPPEVMRYVVFKGSIAVDGISLTVAGVAKKSFRIWIIPHTFEVTALRERKVGGLVNLEADMIGKYVEQFINARK